MSKPLAFAFALACLVGANAAAHAQGPRPSRVLSLNQCTDQLILDFLPPERIVSVTYRARYSADPGIAAKAARVGVNYGSAEEVLAGRPDLVLSGTLSTPATRALLKRAGFPLIEVPAATNFDDIREATRLVARAVGAEATAEDMLREMDATLTDLARTRPLRAIRVVAWDGGGTVPGRGTLFDSILTAAGGVNIAAGGEGTRSGNFGVEDLILARPDAIAFGDDTLAQPSLRTATLQHPVVRALFGAREVTYPDSVFSCGVPQSAGAAQSLREKLVAVVTKNGAPP